MPGLDGLNAAKAIRQALKEKRWDLVPPILLMVTTRLREEILAQPGIEGVVKVISKPITSSTLYSVVADSLHQRGPGLFPSDPVQIGAAGNRRIPGVRVLVVDDSDINREVAKGILEADGAIVYTACDGQDALEWLQAHPDAADIVLMDLQMPRLDGYTATRVIRKDKRWRELPIVALTAGAFQELRDAAKESGMSDFIAKPFNVAQMMDTIRHLTGCLPGKVASDAEGVTELADLSSASPPVSEVDSDTPDFLPDIDLPKALEQWGQTEVYRTYLDKFVSTFAQSGLAIAAACRENDLKQAAALTHKLCGVAGTLFMPKITELACKLDTRLKANDVALELVTDLQAAIDQACLAINAWKEFENPAAMPGFTDKYPDDELLPLFRGILEAIEQNDPDSSEIWLSRLRVHLGNFQLNELEVLLAEFDFRGAEAAVKSLLQRLNF